MPLRILAGSDIFQAFMMTSQELASYFRESLCIFDLKATTKREALAEMRARIKEDDQTVPYRRGDYFYYSRTEQGQQ